MFAGEARVAMTPDSAVQLQRVGYECLIETGAGLAAGLVDEAYRRVGATVVETAAALWDEADVIAKVRPPETAEARRLKPGKTLISSFYPAQNKDLLGVCREHAANVIAIDMVPRISRAQKMDALSSMANIAGYRAVIELGNHFGRFFTGQITAAGKVPPAKVLVVGAGVAGLAAIGTATSLGAITYAFDVRPEVAEQIELMGAQFVYLEFKDQLQDGAATGGYAAPSSPQFREAQLKKFREIAPEMDIVITTALVPGRDAPVLWTKDMIQAMKPGCVIVDLAAERGGNCELTKPDQKVVTPNGVVIIGYTDFPSRMAAQASTLYATNIRHMMADLTPGKDGKIVHNMNDDVIRGATVTFEGAITYPPPPPPSVQAIAAQKPKERTKELTTEERRAQEGANPLPDPIARRRHVPPADCWCLCADKLHEPFHCLRARVLRRSPSDLERLAFAAHATDGCHQRHLRHHRARRSLADRLVERARRPLGGDLGVDRFHQRCRRLSGHAPDARHVPEVMKGTRGERRHCFSGLHLRRHPFYLVPRRPLQSGERQASGLVRRRRHGSGCARDGVWPRQR